MQASSWEYSVKRIIFLFAGLLMPLLLCAQEDDSLVVLFWNLENFFDFKDDGTGDSDSEFSAAGTRRWSKKRFYTKCNAVAKTLLWAGSKCGSLPDVIGFAEVENSFVLRQLLQQTPLRKYDYSYVHFDSPDRRGIDVALLYRRSSFVDVEGCPLRLEGLSTRDMLLVETAGGKGEWRFIVNHHPSKFGGAGESREKRRIAMRRLCDACDSLGGRRIIAMGDFNDTPEGDAFALIDSILVNKALPLHEKGFGTIRYDGRWELIDMFLVSPELAGNCSMEILQPPFLLVQDKKHGGYKPLRTYSGPRYQSGVSDHLPVVLEYGRRRD